MQYSQVCSPLGLIHDAYGRTTWRNSKRVPHFLHIYGNIFLSKFDENYVKEIRNLPFLLSEIVFNTAHVTTTDASRI